MRLGVGLVWCCVAAAGWPSGVAAESDQCVEGGHLVSLVPRTGASATTTAPLTTTAEATDGAASSDQWGTESTELTVTASLGPTGPGEPTVYGASGAPLSAVATEASAYLGAAASADMALDAGAAVKATGPQIHQQPLPLQDPLGAQPQGTQREVLWCSSPDDPRCSPRQGAPDAPQAGGDQATGGHLPWAAPQGDTGRLTKRFGTPAAAGGPHEGFRGQPERPPRAHR